MAIALHLSNAHTCSAPCTQGVLSLKRSHLDPLIVFIDVPDIQVLQQRLEDRLAKDQPAPSTTPSTPTAVPRSVNAAHLDQVRKWMEKVPQIKEFAKDASFFHGHIVNDNLEVAFQQLRDFCMDVYMKSKFVRDAPKQEGEVDISLPA
jgi:guanylate kinase